MSFLIVIEEGWEVGFITCQLLLGYLKLKSVLFVFLILQASTYFPVTTTNNNHNNF